MEGFTQSINPVTMTERRTKTLSKIHPNTTAEEGEELITYFRITNVVKCHN